MTTRYACSLNGLALEAISPLIYVLDIVESPPSMHAETAEHPLHAGSRMLRLDRVSLSVRVSFAIRAYDVAQRKAICSQVAAWAARGGYLTVNDRPGQRLAVRCTTLPVIASALRWTDALSMTFTAYEVPFWEAENPVSVHVSAAAASSTVLTVPGGYGQAWLDAELVCSGTATVTLTTPLSSMTLSSVSGTVSIRHDAGVLSIRSSGGASLLTRRTASSSDDLLVRAGEDNRIQLSATQAVSASFSARGCFL